MKRSERQESVLVKLEVQLVHGYKTAKKSKTDKIEPTPGDKARISSEIGILKTKLHKN